MLDDLYVVKTKHPIEDIIYYAHDDGRDELELSSNLSSRCVLNTREMIDTLRRLEARYHTEMSVSKLEIGDPLNEAALLKIRGEFLLQDKKINHKDLEALVSRFQMPISP
jgi:hypothetical protein